MPYTRFLFFVASSPAYCALPLPTCLPTNSAVTVADCSGDGPNVRTYGLLASTSFCGTAVAQVPMHITPRCASSSAKTDVDCWGPPRTANGFFSAIAMASALAAAVSDEAAVPVKDSTEIL